MRVRVERQERPIVDRRKPLTYLACVISIAAGDIFFGELNARTSVRSLALEAIDIVLLALILAQSDNEYIEEPQRVLRQRRSGLGLVPGLR